MKIKFKVSPSNDGDRPGYAKERLVCEPAEEVLQAFSALTRKQRQAVLRLLIEDRDADQLRFALAKLSASLVVIDQTDKDEELLKTLVKEGESK